MVEATSSPRRTPRHDPRPSWAVLPHGCEPRAALEKTSAARYEGRGGERGCAWARPGRSATAPDLAFLMRQEVEETRKLSRAPIRDAGDIAYHQPVTPRRIEEKSRRGRRRGPVDQLIEMEWVRFGRSKMTPGRAGGLTWSTKAFSTIGLEPARDLPGLKEMREGGCGTAARPTGRRSNAHRRSAPATCSRMTPRLRRRRSFDDDGYDDD